MSPSHFSHRQKREKTKPRHTLPSKLGVYCPLVSILLSAAHPEKPEERRGEGGRAGEGFLLAPHLLLASVPSSPPPTRPRSRVGPWHEGQARVDTKLDLSSFQLQTPHPSHKRKLGVQDLRADASWLTVPLGSGDIEDLVTLI